MKRIALIILTLIAIAGAARAQLATGTWRQVPIHGEYGGMVETDDNLWYITGGCLYQYDKEADETRFYLNGRDLSDFSIKFMRYCPEGDFIALAYENGNIDLVYPDGTRYNLPEIKDAIVNVDRTVNDIAFDGKDMYVSTGFGLVLYDTDRREVKESGIYDVALGRIFVTPWHIFVSTLVWDSNWRYWLYRLPKGESIRKFDRFTSVRHYYGFIHDMAQLDDEGVLYAKLVANESHPSVIRFNEDGTFVNDESNYRDISARNLSRGKDGTVRFISGDGTLYHFKADGSGVEADGVLGAAFGGHNMFASREGLKSFWLGDTDGLGNYRWEDGKMTVLRDKSATAGAVTFSNVHKIYPSADPSRFYIATQGMSKLNPLGSGDHHDIRMRLNIVSRDGVADINPADVPAISAPTLSYQSSGGKYIFNPTMIVDDPDNPDRIYVATGGEGVYVVENGEVVAKYDGTNSPIFKLGDYCYATVYVGIDNEGNLWVGWRGNADTTNIMMLPAAKRRGMEPASVSRGDWVEVNYCDNNLKDRDMYLLHCKHSDMIIGFDTQLYNGIVAINHRGTPGDVSDDVAVNIKSFTDQDGKTLEPVQITTVIEDKRGHVWVGTVNGVFSFPNPARATESSFTVNRIKVPRNDGSGLADYLLDSDHINAIAVDASDRKWIATRGSGLYLVSEDGDRILATFTKDNSILPTNEITSVYADPESNSIWVATMSGLFEYSADSSPARGDYSDVYAYPNPVTPGYTGWITIAGLMDNSLVKIVDSGMNLVYQTVSEGGMAMWDGCTMQGARVRSGVYYVLASTTTGDTSLGGGSTTGDVVAKILVVN